MSARYDQCDATCTTDCGHCKGAGRPVNARDLLDEVETRLASPMVTYKENATEDAPRLTAAVRAVLYLHRPVTVFALADSCDGDDDHADVHHFESPDEGEWLCAAKPTGDVWCAECADLDGDRVDAPCPTVRAITGALGGEPRG